MIVNDVPRRNDYVASEGQTTFPYTFSVADASHIQVIENDVEILVGYTVDGVGTAEGGNIIFQIGRAGGSHIVLLGRQPFAQNSVYSIEAFPPKRIESDLSKIVMQTQQLHELLGRALILNRMTTVFPGEIALPSGPDLFLRVISTNPLLFDWATLVMQGAVSLPLSFANGGLGSGYANADAVARGLSVARWASASLTPTAGAVAIPDPITANRFAIGAGNFASIGASGVVPGTVVLFSYTAGGNVITDGAGLQLLGRTNYTTTLGDTSEFLYNGTAWIELSRTLLPDVSNATKLWRGDGTWQAITTNLKRGIGDGLWLSNSAGDPTNDIDISAGDAVSDEADPTTRIHMHLAAALTDKQLDVEWAAGSSAGLRLAADALADDTWHVFVFRRSGGALDAVASLSLSPTLPDGGTNKIYVGSIVRSAGALRGFVQLSRARFTFSAAAPTQTLSGSGTGNNTVVLPSLPNLVRVTAFGHFAGSASGTIRISSLAQVAGEVPVAADGNGVTQSAGNQGNPWTTMTDVARSIRVRSSANMDIKITVSHWINHLLE